MFKVPNKFRIRSGRLGSDDSAGNSGAFQVESKIPGRLLFIIASDGSDWQESGLPGEPWEHVSVHAEVGGKNRMPTWDEMAQVKRFVLGWRGCCRSVSSTQERVRQQPWVHFALVASDRDSSANASADNCGGKIANATAA